MDYSTLSTAELTAAYNDAFSKDVKPGSYTRAKMIAALEKEAVEQAAANEAANPASAFEASDTHQDEAPATDDVEARLNDGRCPLCGGDPANQTAAGAEGTFLGDSCQECHDCGKIYNCITGEEIPEAAQASTKKRRIINPQAKINAKTEALKAVEITLFYDRPNRIWTMTSDREDELGVLHMSSREFAEYTTKELVDRAVFHLRPQA